jgi:hypothetical protein
VFLIIVAKGSTLPRRVALTSNSLDQAVCLLQVVVEREGTDLDEVSDDSADATAAATNLASDALVTKAREYSLAAYRPVQTKRPDARA